MALAKSVLSEIDREEDKGIDTCLTCPSLCRWACPVAEAEARETVAPNRLVVLGGLLKRGVAPIESAGDLPYHCTHCGACTQACLHKNDVPMLLSLARGRVLAGHLAPHAVSEVRGRFGVAGNPQGAALDGVLARITGEADVDLTRGGSTVYFPGCETLGALPEAVGAFLRTTLLFGLSGVSVTPVSAMCCGLALLWAGDLEGFTAHAERFASQVKDIETLVVHDPACAHAIQRRYPIVGVTVRPKIVHVADFLLDALASTRVVYGGGDLPSRWPSNHASSSNGPSRSTPAYADTCNLARGLGIVDQPRRLIQKLADQGPIELRGLRGVEVDCCGASGLLPLSAPHTARAMAEAKIQSFRDSGASELAMFSPRCAAHLRSIDPTLPVVDVTMLLARL